MAHAKASIGTTNYQAAIVTGHHRLTADEGPALGGKDVGPGPYELLTSALAACTVITLRMYAERKQWPVTAVHADVHFVRDGDRQHIDRVQRERGAAAAERRPGGRPWRGGLETRTRLSCLPVRGGGGGPKGGGGKA